MLGPERRGVVLPGATGGARPRRLLGWAVLGALLGALVAGAVFYDPTPAEPPTGDGVTHWMQASSLAHDQDLNYGPRDYHRFATAWGAPPEGLRLRSRDGGERIAYDVPVPYALALAPAVRLAPVRGAAIIDALLLALSALAAARVLQRRLGVVAPLYVAVCVFASVVFTYAFRVGPELFSLAAVVGAFALALRGEGPPARAYAEVYSGALPGEEAGRKPWRWIGVGALLALAVAHHPFYLVLVWPLALAPPFGRRRLGASVLVLSVLTVGGAVAAAGWSAGDDWIPWSQSGRVFLSETGFPAIDTPVSAWPQERPAEPLAWLPGAPAAPVADGSLWGWNLLLLGVGRASGLAVYFLPVLLALAALPGSRGGAGGGRLAIPWAVAGALSLVLLVHPYDVAGALDGPANPFFLPLYGALWFAAARPLRPAPVLAVALLAAPFLFPSWLAPRTVARPDALARGAYVSPVAARLLPHESTQRDVPGVEEIQHGVLWLRSLGPGISAAPGEDRLRLDTGRGGELMVASPVALAGLRLVFARGGPTQADLVDAELTRTTLTPSGGVILEIDPGAPDRSHPLWWTRGEVFLYRVGLAFPVDAAEGDGHVIPLEIVPVYEDEAD